MAKRQDRMKEAGENLQKILEDLQPYIRKPVVRGPPQGPVDQV